MRHDPLKFGTYFKAWICFYVVAVFTGAVLGGIVGGILGGILSGMGYEIGSIKSITYLVGIAISIPISCVTFIWATKRYIVSRLLPPELPINRPETHAQTPNAL